MRYPPSAVIVVVKSLQGREGHSDLITPLSVRPHSSDLVPGIFRDGEKGWLSSTDNLDCAANMASPVGPSYQSTFSVL